MYRGGSHGGVKLSQLVCMKSIGTPPNHLGYKGTPIHHGWVVHTNFGLDFGESHPHRSIDSILGVLPGVPRLTNSHFFKKNLMRKKSLLIKIYIYIYMKKKKLIIKSDTCHHFTSDVVVPNEIQ